MRLLLAGVGSSRHAAEVAGHWWRRWGLEAEAHPATELADGEETFWPRRRGETPDSCLALVAVTQSGSTASVLRLLDEAGAAGVFRVVVTNEADSRGAKRADLAVVTRAGPEQAIPATKSFTAALMALRILGLDWAEAAGTLPLPRVESLRRDHGAILSGPESALRKAREAAEFADRPAGGPWFFLGDSSLRPLASEGALKMVETAVVPALALPSGELAHGPRTLLGPETPVVVLSEGGHPTPSEHRSLVAAREAGAPILRFTAGRRQKKRIAGTRRKDDEGILNLWSGRDVSVAPFSAAPLLQLLALYAGVRRGRNVDAPEGLRKAVKDD